MLTAFVVKYITIVKTVVVLQKKTLRVFLTSLLILYVTIVIPAKLIIGSKIRVPLGNVTLFVSLSPVPYA